MSTFVVGQSGSRYERGREIGRGGFGVVYVATGPANEEYALKLIGPVRDREAQETFEREIRAAQNVDNEHVLKVVDFGTHKEASGDLYLFTIAELCPDGDYRRRMMSYRLDPLDVPSVVADFRQILAGLQALHERIVHRDVKPENIFDRDGILKIGDFGLSRFIDQATRTLTFKGFGSPQYMAPEVWSMHRTTPATDLYAIGVMLYEAVTGQAPFVSGGDINRLCQMHLFTPAPRAKSINRSVPDRLEGIVKKLLEKEPSNRFQSSGEVLEALSNVQSGEPSADVAEIAARLRQHHDTAEQRRLADKQKMEADLTDLERNRYKEQELRGAIEEVISEINTQLEEVKIQQASNRAAVAWRFGNRTLVLHFFSPGELYADPEIPGRMETLRRRHVVHGGYIEIQENGEDREGWNVVLVRPPDSLYGQWILVETDVSALTGRSARYKPFATQAKLFADNLSCHWAPAMHVYSLRDKPFERVDILKILKVFVG